MKFLALAKVRYKLIQWLKPAAERDGLPPKITFVTLKQAEEKGFDIRKIKDTNKQFAIFQLYDFSRKRGIFTPFQDLLYLEGEIWKYVTSIKKTI